MLKAQSITCVRGDRLLFQDLNLEVRSGEACQIQGGNGVGKTTLLRTLCGLSLPESGEIFWNDAPIHEDPGKFHSDLVYIGHSNGIKLDLTPKENLTFALQLRDCHLEWWLMRLTRSTCNVAGEGIVSKEPALQICTTPTTQPRPNIPAAPRSSKNILSQPQLILVFVIFICRNVNNR